MYRNTLDKGREEGFRTNPNIRGKLCIKQVSSSPVVSKIRSESALIKHSADHDVQWLEFIDSRAKAHGLFKEKESNRLDYPLDSEVPPLQGEEEMELNSISEEREWREKQEMAEMFGPLPGRFETEWN